MSLREKGGNVWIREKERGEVGSRTALTNSSPAVTLSESQTGDTWAHHWDGNESLFPTSAGMLKEKSSDRLNTPEVERV